MGQIGTGAVIDPIALGSLSAIGTGAEGCTGGGFTISESLNPDEWLSMTSFYTSKGLILSGMRSSRLESDLSKRIGLPISSSNILSLTSGVIMSIEGDWGNCL
jgi:hypothetical protein